MTTTTFARAPKHTLVQQRDSRGRLGSFHAAIRVAALDTTDPTPLLEQRPMHIWRTACGNELVDDARTPIVALSDEAALEAIEHHASKVCTRCDRVGAAYWDAQQ